ncbi:MAG: hypothetical protein ACHQPI_02690 [Thermoanaerobaculia bacterium]
MRRVLPRTIVLASRFVPLLVVAVVVGLFQPGCVNTGPIWTQIRLYDVRAGALFFGHVDSNPNGTRHVEVTMPNGEVCTGEYSIVQEGFTSWTLVFGTVWGPDFWAQTSSARTDARGYGIARSPGGTVLECAFLTDGHQGYGACTDNKRNRYKVLF